jgi:hypothetical protein
MTTRLTAWQGWRRPLAAVCLALTGVGLLSQAGAQGFERDLPVHAHYSATEQGWTCNDGFRQVAGFCTPESLGLPNQGAVEVFDGQWRCRVGYQRTNGYCVPLTAPAHASLVGDGGSWECDWGFRKVASRCEEIVPPAHAYLDASGRDWVCFPGYQRMLDGCVLTEADKPTS